MVNGADDVKKNAWFQGVNWNMVFQKKIQPPWVPELSGKTDHQFFDDYPDSGSPAIEPNQE